MYLDYYDLREHPFRTNPNPRFLWFGEKHREAMAVLKYGILKSDGFLLLTGDVGTGKTTLVRHLVNTVEDRACIANVADPDMGTLDFYNALSEAFGIRQRFRSKSDFLSRFRQFLLASHARGKRAFLIIDEAQRLNHDLLEQIRLLSNIELDEQKLMLVFLVGQDEVEDLLMEERNRPFRQRITTSHRLEHLTAAETERYIAHRLKVAGARRGFFTLGACRRIFEATDGIPRLINSICDCAMLSGYVKDRKRIDSRMVGECLIDMRIAVGLRQKPTDRPEATFEGA